MGDIEQQIKVSAESLRKALTGLPTSLSALPQECYNLWNQHAPSVEYLVSTLKLFPAREKTLEMINELVSKVPQLTNMLSNNDVIDDRIKNFVTDRHLAFVAYVAITWSIYDRLANVCGRLASTTEFPANPRQNPKLVENFLNKATKDTGM